MGDLLLEYLDWMFAFLILGLLFAPLATFLLSGWIARRREILDAFSGTGIRLYFEAFFQGAIEAQGTLPQAFRRLYHTRFGRRHFALPALFLVVLVGVCSILASDTVLHWLSSQHHPPIALPPIAMAALAGAFMWTGIDLLRRVCRRDLRPVDLYRYAFRFFVAVPLAYVFAAIVKEGAGIPIAFVLGTFPTRTLVVMCRRFGSERLKLGDIVEREGLELESLQGIRKPQAERFGEEGVDTMVQLAYADPVDLTMRAGFSFSYVVDCCSQALAWIYFESAVIQLRPFGLRGAQEMHFLAFEMDGEDEDEAKRAKATVKAAANAVEVDQLGFEYALRQVAEDPYTKFLCDIWQTCEDEQDEEEGD